MKFRFDNMDMIGQFFADTRLLGIVAPIEQYKFCWHLNNLTNFQFRINNDLEIPMIKKERKYFFSIYTYREAKSLCEHYLYNNQQDGEFLLPEFRNLDFLWLIRDEYIDGKDLSGLIDAVKSIPNVQMVTELDQTKIRNKQNLIL